MGGLGLQERLVENGHGIPVIILSAHGDAKVHARALAAGAIAFPVEAGRWRHPAEHGGAGARQALGEFESCAWGVSRALGPRRCLRRRRRPRVREATRSLLASVGLRVKTFGTAQEFLHSPRPDAPACLVLDVRLPGPSGLDLQRELASAGVAIPIIFITGHGDVRCRCRP